MRFFHGFRIKEVLEAKYHLPVMALNDGKAVALAELATGHLQGVTNGAALVLGSGLGGGFIINGKLFQGSHFQAGELTFLLPVQMEKVDPSLMRGMTLSAAALPSLSAITGRWYLASRTSLIRKPWKNLNKPP